MDGDGPEARANAGFLFVHQDYEDVDIYDPANYVWTEGNTTYVYVPTKNLPLLEPLRWVGLSALADALNEPLKEIVERAYDRSYLPAQPGLPAPEPDPEPEPEPEAPVEGEAPADDGPAEPVAALAAAKTVIDEAERDKKPSQEVKALKEQVNLLNQEQ